MHILSIDTPLLRAGDDLSAILLQSATIQRGDIFVISSKAVATVEGTTIELATVQVSNEAVQWAKKTGRSPECMQAVLDETTRMHGTVLGSAPHALLTDLRPEGFPQGRLLVPNAGLDESNVKKGWAVGWPVDPVKSAARLRKELIIQVSDHSPLTTVAVILSDSCCTPGRLGVTAFALAVSGIDPFQSQIGRHDLFQKPLSVTQEAIADQLATAANMVMGNADQSCPAAIVRDHGIPFSAYEGWVGGIESTLDLFGALIRP